VVDRSLTGVKVAAALTPIVAQRGAPTAITVDNGGEFVSRAMEAWACAHDVRLEFIRPGKPVENAFIEMRVCISPSPLTSLTQWLSSSDASVVVRGHVRTASVQADHAPLISSTIGGLLRDLKQNKNRPVSMGT
jgi:hypothetical protein